MRILSFDQSSQITGWAVFNDGEYCAHGAIDLHRMKSDVRFDKMCELIRGKIDEVHPDLVIIEDVMLMRSPQAMKLLAQIQGVILGYCQANKLPVTIYLPSSWRKILGFKQAKTPREELKRQAIELVHSAYGISATSDEADAICIAMAHIKNHLED